MTAETAMALPALAVVLLAALGMLAAAGSALRCVDAARLGARAAARGESTAAVVALARADAPAGATVRVTREPGSVRVEVRAAVPLLGQDGRFAGLQVRGDATAPAETQTDTAGLPAGAGPA